MTDPIGQGTFEGLGVPLHGESVIRQENSSNAIVTLMHSTANTGRFLLGTDYKSSKGFSSVITDHAVFDIAEDGAFQCVSGTSVGIRLNTSGLFNSTDERIMGSSGEQGAGMQQVVTFSSDGTTAQYLTAANSGKLHIVSTNSGSSIVISLPTTAIGGDIAVGMYWDVFMNTSDADVLSIASIGVDKGVINAHHGSSDVLHTTISIANGTSGPFWVRILCDSTADLKVWTVRNFLGNNSGADAAYFTLIEGTSALS